MKKKVLFVATVDSHIELFHLPFLKMFKDHGYEIHVATDSDKKIKYCDKKIKLPIKRSPFSFSNLRAIRQLKKVIKTESYETIHCHTPMGGVVARLAAKKARRAGTRVIYTAHGFHFYEGAPIKNWALFYPVEKRLAKFTDTLITINDEDFELAKRKFGKRCYDIQYVPGVGVDEKKFEKRLGEKQKKDLRKSLKLKVDDKVLICVGRLDKNKNQGFLIKMMPELIEKSKNYQLLLVGPDEMNGKYQKIAERWGVSKNVHFLGARDDVPELLQIADVVASASKREGLPVNLMEAAFLGIPIVATDCRGNRDVCEVVGGKIAGQDDTEDFVKYVVRKAELDKKGFASEYTISSISEKMDKIYKKQKLNLKNNPLIDFVVLWVDDSDQKWLKKKEKYKPESGISRELARYRDWGTFKYWFRGVEKYAPWVNHIYLVTDGQVPKWLNKKHPKLTIVDHKEIMDAEDLPTFNSQAIEMNLHKIPGLNEHFVYFNDDTFLINKVKPTDFFKHGLPVSIANINAATGMEGDQLYAQAMFNDILLINRHFKKKEVMKGHILKWLNPKYGSFNFRTLSQMPYPYFTGYKPHHMPAPLLKSTFAELWEKEGDVLKETSSHRFRHPHDVNQDIFTMWQLCENKFVPKSKKVGGYVGLNSDKDVRRAVKMIRSAKKMVCINDGSVAKTEEKFQKVQSKILQEFHNKMPEASQFEIFKEKKTVLHVISTLKRGGTEQYLMNLINKTADEYRNVILYYYGDNAWNEELFEKSVNVYKCNAEKILKNIFRVIKIRKIIKQEKVDIVYSYTYHNSVFVLLAACLSGVKKRIVHSHRISYDKKMLGIKLAISKKIISLLATDQLACSDEAGKSLFANNNFDIVRNGIDVERFEFNAQMREKMRKELKAKNGCVLLGVVGWINKNKNQRFAIEILKELLARGVDAKLVLVGEGDGDEDAVLKEFCREEKIKDRVIFVGRRKNIQDYYNAFDMLLVPSFMESFSFTMIEGQANGVPIIVSKTVNTELKHNKNVCILCLEDGADTWADIVQKFNGERVVPNKHIFDYTTDSIEESVVGIYERQSIGGKLVESTVCD